VSNYLLEETAKGFEKALEELKNRTTDVNRERKQTQVRMSLFQSCLLFPKCTFQTRLGGQLSSLETRWTELISNLLQIELANVALEAELEELKKREEELSNL
jgi:pre-mRNA-splicing factor SPF27